MFFYFLILNSLLMNNIKYIINSIVFLFVISLIFFSNNLNAQNIVVTDDDGYTAHSSAVLDVKSSTKGLLIPRLTTSDRTTLESTATAGLLVFDVEESVFYYFDGSNWVNVSKGQVWTLNSNYVLLTDSTSRVGIGTYNPNSKLEVKADASFTDSDTLFAVKDKNGNIVFAVFPDGAKVYVNETAKGKVGGFAVSGRSPSKGVEEEYLKVTPDSTRIWVNSDADSKGKVGGFAVSGRSPSKTTIDDYLVITPDSARIYINDTVSTKGKVGGIAVSGRSPSKGTSNNIFLATADSTRIYVDEEITKGKVGGFAVSGRSPSKGVTNNYMEVSRDSTRIYVTEGLTKGKVGGFAVSGRSPSKGTTKDYLNVSGNIAADIVTNEKRIMWYPQKAALLAGEVHVGSSDSVGTNSMAMGYRSISKGDYSQAMGYNAEALGINSTAIGNYAIAKMPNSFAIGDSAIAEGIGSFAIGSVGRDTLGVSTVNPAKALGDYSFAFGLGTIADNRTAFAFGSNTTASGVSSTAFGHESVAGGQFSVAGGYHALAYGRASVAFGDYAIAQGEYSVAFGDSYVSGFASFAAGAINDVYGSTSMAIGSENYIPAAGSGAIALGSQNASRNNSTVAIGYRNDAVNTGNVAIGYENLSDGNTSFAIGYNTTSSGTFSMAFGNQTEALGSNSYVFGNQSIASGNDSYAFGKGVEASGLYSFAVALNDETGTIVSQDNTMAIMGGRVGIGVASPTDTLEVAGNLNLNNGISSGTALSVNSAQAIWFNGSYFSWGSGGGANYFADEIGIGTSAPGKKLHLVQVNLANSGLRIAKYGNSTYWDIGVRNINNKFAFYFGATLKAEIDDLDGSYDVGSDRRLKKEIVELGSVLNKVVQLKPSSFYFKDAGELDPKSIGFIAQDVELIFPELINEFEKNGITYKGLTYDDFAVLSIQAVKDLNNRLEEEVSNQNIEISELKTKLIQQEKTNQELIKRLEIIEEKLNNN